jgi:fructose-specific component phosphotransferase system IIB-like protein
VIRPIVIGPNGVPVVTDVDRAVREPELAVLSAMAHGNQQIEAAAVPFCRARARRRKVHAIR